MIKKIIGTILLTSPFWLWFIVETIQNIKKYGLLVTIIYWLIVLIICFGLPCLGFYIITRSERGNGKEVFVVTADTYNDDYGADIELFGVYSNFEVADKASSFLTEKGYLAQVDKVKMDKATYISLGGYIE